MSLVNSANPKLTALWELDKPQAIALCIRAFESTGGDVKAAARMLKCSRQTLFRHLRENAFLHQRLQEIRKHARAAKRGA